MGLAGIISSVLCWGKEAKKYNLNSTKNETYTFCEKAASGYFDSFMNLIVVLGISSVNPQAKDLVDPRV